MLQSCFYQIAEYVMAPFGLMLFTFYVKNVGSPKSTYKPIIERNGIESLLIACYSCMLFYLSIVAHSTPEIDIIYENTKTGVLLAGFFGLIFLIILKYHAKDWGENDQRSNSWPNYAALGMMLFLFYNILYKNTHGFSIYFDFKAKTLWSNIIDIGNFIVVPPTLIIIAFMILITYLYVINTKKLMGTRLESNIDKYAGITNENDLNSYAKASTDNSNPANIKIQALVKIAESLLENGSKQDLERSKNELILAKKLAIENNYPLNLEYGIRILLVRVYNKMGRKDLGTNEIDEFVLTNSNLNNPIWEQSGKAWELKLRAILD